MTLSDAWIYGEGASDASSRLLAELGFTPHRVSPNGTLRPVAGEARAPALVVVRGGGPQQPSCAELCARLSEDEGLGEVPIIVTVPSAVLDEDISIIEGHELLVEPFGAAELRARIVRARRAVNGIAHDDVVRTDGLELNLASYEVTVAGGPVDFTYMEFELLRFLVTHPKRAFSREALLHRVWGHDFYGGARTIDVHVRRIRGKLGHELAARIKTVRSVGYRWDGP